MKYRILLEISNQCKNCHLNNKCIEENCILYRIENIILEKREEKKNDKNSKSRFSN